MYLEVGLDDDMEGEKFRALQRLALSCSVEEPGKDCC